MAFFDYGVAMIRILINDMEETPTYSDSRLEETLIVAAQLVQEDMKISTYTINIPEIIITPDPAATSNRDDVFLNLTVLKAACFIDFATFRTKAALEGIRATLGPANIGVSGNLKGFQYLIDKGVCKTYDDVLTGYLFGEKAIVKAILSPFSSPNWDPGLYIRTYYPESRFRY